MGESAIVLTCGEPSLHVQQRLWETARVARDWLHVREAVTGAGNLTLLYDPHGVSYDALAARLLAAWRAAVAHSLSQASHARSIEIAVRYGGKDGPDLADVARLCGLSTDEAIERHCAQTYVVSFLGFLPGFGYLDGLDARLHVPRRAQPRTRVPAGSVAIAGRYSGIYPLDSPGGWHLVGRTESRLFDPTREPFALLAAGDVVRFVPR